VATVGLIIFYVREAVSPGVKIPGREADYSKPFSAEAMNGGATPPLCHTSSWTGAELIKHGDNFTSQWPCVFSFAFVFSNFSAL
jgi:hypothetical protein